MFVYEISHEPLNGLAPKLHGRRVLSLLDKFECPGPRSKAKVARDNSKRAVHFHHSPTATEWFVLLHDAL